MLKISRLLTLAFVMLSLAASAWAQPAVKKMPPKHELKKAELRRRMPPPPKVDPTKEGADPKQQGADAHAAAMAAMMKQGAPGPQHKALAMMAGTFTAAVTMWMHPGKPPMKTTGTSENKMILGDRFLVQEYSGNLMGHPFNGYGVNGYDKGKKKWIGTWADSMGTTMMVFEGTGDRGNKVITMTSEHLDPMTGQPKKVRAITRIDSPRKHTDEYFELAADGKPRKTMEIVYTRSR